MRRLRIPAFKILALFGRPYYRLHLWYIVSSVCLSSVCNALYCGKTVVLARNCLKKRIGNQGQKVEFLGRRHISTSGFASMATETAVFALFCPYSPAIGTRWYKVTF